MFMIISSYTKLKQKNTAMTTATETLPHKPHETQIVHESNMDVGVDYLRSAVLGIEPGGEDPEALSSLLRAMKSEDLTVRANAERSFNQLMHDANLEIQHTPYDFNEIILAPVEVKDMMNGLRSSIDSDPNSEFHIPLSKDEKEAARKLLDRPNYLDEKEHGNSNLTTNLGNIWDTEALRQAANSLPGNSADNFELVTRVYEKLAAEAPRHFAPKIVEDSAAGVRELIEEKTPGLLDPQDPTNLLMRAYLESTRDSGDTLADTKNRETPNTNSLETVEREKVVQKDVPTLGKDAIALTEEGGQARITDKLTDNPDIAEEDFEVKKINARQLRSAFNEVRLSIKQSEGWTEGRKDSSLQMLEHFLLGKVQEDGRDKVSLNDIWDERFMKKLEREYGELIPYVREHLITLLEESYNKKYPR